MTPAQRTLYFTAWRDAKVAMLALGRTLDTDRAERLRLHKSAGLPESSTAFTNAHLDQFLAACFAWSHAASLAHQQRQINQPGTRCRHVCDSLLALIAEIDPSAIDLAQARPYVDSIFRRIHKDPSADPDWAEEDAWTPVIMALVYRYDQVVRRALGKRKSRPLAHHPRKHRLWLADVRYTRQRAAQVATLAKTATPVDEPAECPF